MRRLLIALALCVGAAMAHADTVVWDYAPVDGDAVCCWQNQTAAQNFADNFTLAQNTNLTGFNLFTGNFPPQGTYNVHLYADNGGIPGALLQSIDVSASSFAFYGTFNSVDVYEVMLQFAAIPITAGTQYWIGASGNGFEAGQLSLAGPGDPGDGQMAQFSGQQFQFMTQVGDQSYQLVTSGGGAVPEPASLFLLGSGLLGLGGVTRKRIKKM